MVRGRIANMKFNAYKILCILVLLFVGCASPKKEASFCDVCVAGRDPNGRFGKALIALMGRIERGDLSAWKTFASYSHRPNRLDGECAETYALACSELARRDPTFYLRRYLIGDTRAIALGRNAYNFSASRSLLDAVYADRLYIAANEEERRQIQTFIRETTKR